MEEPDTPRHQGLRKKLVLKLQEEIYIPEDIYDINSKKILERTPITNAKVLEAIGRIPRHLFFPQPDMGEVYGYQDLAFKIGEGQTISQPYTVARQTELLEVKPNDKILEIGTGSGYQATVLMLLKAKVYSIERHKILYDRTSDHLMDMREFLLNQSKNKKAVAEKRTWKNEPEMWPVKCIYGDGFEGSPMNAPFDKILITAAVPELPQNLLKQLAIGGKIVFPFGEKNNCTMIRKTKIDEENYVDEKFGVYAFVPMLTGKT